MNLRHSETNGSFIYTVWMDKQGSPFQPPAPAHTAQSSATKNRTLKRFLAMFLTASAISIVVSLGCTGLLSFLLFRAPTFYQRVFPYQYVCALLCIVPCLIVSAVLRRSEGRVGAWSLCVSIALFTGLLCNMAITVGVILLYHEFTYEAPTHTYEAPTHNVATP